MPPAPTSPAPIVRPTGIHHVRLTVTDIDRSKAFYRGLLDAELAFDFSERADQPGVRDDPAQLFGGCGFWLGDQLLGLRPIGPSGDRFEPARVGLDHISLRLSSLDELRAAEARLTEAGVAHGEIKHLDDVGMAIMSVQDPDDINLELMVPLG